MRADPATLSHACDALLKRAEGLDRYGYEKHRVLAALCGGLHATGWTLDQARSVLLDPRNEGARWLSERWGGEYVSQIGSKWRAVERRHAKFSTEVDEWARFALTHWPYGGKSARLRVLLGLGETARQCGTWEFQLDNRSLAIVSGVGGITAHALDASTATARSAAEWLSKHLTLPDGRSCFVMERPGQHAARNARRLSAGATASVLDWNKTSITYRLPTLSDLRKAFEHHCRIRPTQSLRDIPWMNGLLSAANFGLHPVWEDKGLGVNSGRLYMHLLACQGGATAASLAGQTHISPRTAHDALARLSEARLAHSESGRWVADHRDLDDVADELGVADRRACREFAARRQRGNYRAAITGRARPSVPANVDPFTGEVTRQPAGSDSETLAVVLPFRRRRPHRVWHRLPPLAVAA